MRFDIITIFPKLFDSFLNESLIKKFLNKNGAVIKIHNLRNWTKDKHKKVDDKPYGGGPGMILMAPPIIAAIKNVKMKSKKNKVILLTPGGEQFNQKKAAELLKANQVIFICGRYEGVDARVEKIIDEKISIGPYIMSGGELPAMVIMETMMRLMSGYLGNPESLKEETKFLKSGKKNEYAQYTRPAEIKIGRKKHFVPRVLLSGHHKKILTWRKIVDK
ncbi:MAG TPA: tRNA (guanosine(37)-N1)-methyltransferase TrmD [bacterium]|nr:tRNA (guanosine(37)-N1)-methyltransferase TrmD [bacterium]